MFCIKPQPSNTLSSFLGKTRPTLEGLLSSAGRLGVAEVEFIAEIGGRVTTGSDIGSEYGSSLGLDLVFGSFFWAAPDDCFGVKPGKTRRRSVTKSISGSWSPSSCGIRGEERIRAARKRGTADVTASGTVFGGYLETRRRTAKLEVDLQRTIYWRKKIIGYG